MRDLLWNYHVVFHSTRNFCTTLPVGGGNWALRGTLLILRFTFQILDNFSFEAFHLCWCSHMVGKEKGRLNNDRHNLWLLTPTHHYHPLHILFLSHNLFLLCCFLLRGAWRIVFFGLTETSSPERSGSRNFPSAINYSDKRHLYIYIWIMKLPVPR